MAGNVSRAALAAIKRRTSIQPPGLTLGRQARASACSNLGGWCTPTASSSTSPLGSSRALTGPVPQAATSQTAHPRGDEKATASSLRLVYEPPTRRQLNFRTWLQRRRQRQTLAGVRVQVDVLVEGKPLLASLPSHRDPLHGLAPEPYGGDGGGGGAAGGRERQGRVRQHRGNDAGRPNARDVRLNDIARQCGADAGSVLRECLEIKATRQPGYKRPRANGWPCNAEPICSAQTLLCLQM
jgi:hypothetical protein